MEDGTSDKGLSGTRSWSPTLGDDTYWDGSDQRSSDLDTPRHGSCATESSVPVDSPFLTCFSHDHPGRATEGRAPGHMFRDGSDRGDHGREGGVVSGAESRVSVRPRTSWSLTLTPSGPSEIRPHTDDPSGQVRGSPVFG